MNPNQTNTDGLTYYPRQPSPDMNMATNSPSQGGIVNTQPLKEDRSKFPYPDHMARVNNYEFYQRLFKGNHFEAFNIRIASQQYGKDYAKLRYIAANFPGLISRVVSDLLFIEPPKIKVPDGDQEFMDALVDDNQLRMVNYESALANSYYGDNLYKVRVGKRNPYDAKSTIIIEEVTPKIYFPLLDAFNAKGEPSEMELAWTFSVGEQTFLRKETHMPGKIRNQVFLMKGTEIVSEIGLDILGIPGIVSEQATGIEEPLVIHVPNFRSGEHFGMSDYNDLEPLFFAINNRLSKNDNILDTHSDPILALPQGILDESGRVKKSKIGLFERPEGVGNEQDPAYITWDAKLDAAEKEIEQLIDLTLMMSEMSHSLFGLDKGGLAESGRALKFKLIRTIAKVQRKQLYYGEGLRKALYIAQLLAKEHGIEVQGKKLKGEAVKPDIQWQDGIPSDMTEMVDVEAKRIDSGTTTKADAIMRLDDVDEDTALKKVKEIDAEIALTMPVSNIGADGKAIKPNANGVTPPNNPKPNVA